MEKRVELEMRGKKPDQVTELNLDNCRATQVAGITDEFTSLEYLSLINVGLTTLKGFPKLPSLKRVDLSDNRLTGGLENLSGLENVTHVNLSGNKIKDFDAVKPLTKFAKLKSLDMFNCEITQTENYRKKVFELLPNMKYLDGFDKDENECDDSDEDDLDDNDMDNDDDDGDDGEEDDSDFGLEYLQSSKAAQDEDETEDFEPEADGEHADDDADDDEEDDVDDEEESSGRGTKRKLEEDSN